MTADTRAGLHVAIIGYVASADVRPYLAGVTGPLPVGSPGAPLMGVLIGELLRRGCRVSAITTDVSLSLDGGLHRFRDGMFELLVAPARQRAWRPNGFRPGRAMDGFAFEAEHMALAIALVAPDIVHAHWTYEHALAALRHSLPTLITCHDSPRAVMRHSPDLYRLVRYLMARRVFARGTAFTAVSEYLAGEVSSYLGGPPPVVSNPVADYALSARGKPRSASALRRVAMVCNGWSRRKNVEVGLQAFAHWRRSEPAAELHLFGQDFGIGQAAHQWAQRRELVQGVCFHGACAHRDLIAALAEMDALLHTAKEETFGVVIAEAMALGLPVVAGRRSGAVPAVMGADIHGLSAVGQLVDVESADAIALGLRTIFDHQYTDRSRAGMRRVREHFTAEAVTSKYLERYHLILNGSGGDR